MKYLAAILFMATLTARGQDKPKVKRLPVYETVMVCPKGQKLYVHAQTGEFRNIPGGGNMVQMLFSWYAWDGKTNYAGIDPYKDAACFKNPPQESK